MDTPVTKAMSALRDIFPNGSDATVTFDIANVGSITLDRNGVREGKADADLVVRADAATLAGILDGELNPMSMYLSGKILVTGDLGLATRLVEKLKQ